MVEKPSLALSYPASCPDDAMQAFLDELAANGISVAIRRDERGPQAGMEDWLATVAFILVFKGFFEAAGKDGYNALKRAVARFWPVFFGEDRQKQIRVFVSGSKKLSTRGFSRAFSLMARTSEGTIKLALHDDATREELDAALSAFLPFLEQVNAGEQSPQYSGGVALVAYNRETKSLYFPDWRDGLPSSQQRRLRELDTLKELALADVDEICPGVVDRPTA
jgi:DNA-binding transcriptional regulator of glucitol operon